MEGWYCTHDVYNFRTTAVDGVSSPTLLFIDFLGSVRFAAGQTSGVEYFETKIRPLLVAKCQACHSTAPRMAGLDLSSAEGFQKGADSGVLIGGSDPSESRLLRAVGYESQIKMPPTGRLKAEEIAAIRASGFGWDRRGLLTTGTAKVSAAKPLADLTEQRKFWSFQPVRKVAPPPVRNQDWGRTRLMLSSLPSSKRKT